MKKSPPERVIAYVDGVNLYFGVRASRLRRYYWLNIRKLAENLRLGSISVRNWHVLNWETDDKIAKKRSVDKRGAKSDEAYVREVLGRLITAERCSVPHSWYLPTRHRATARLG